MAKRDVQQHAQRDPADAPTATTAPTPSSRCPKPTARPYHATSDYYTSPPTPAVLPSPRSFPTSHVKHSRRGPRSFRRPHSNTGVVSYGTTRKRMTQPDLQRHHHTPRSTYHTAKPTKHRTPHHPTMPTTARGQLPTGAREAEEGLKDSAVGSNDQHEGTREAHERPHESTAPRALHTS